jgi:CHAT domain-containing protein
MLQTWIRTKHIVLYVVFVAISGVVISYLRSDVPIEKGTKSNYFLKGLKCHQDEKFDSALSYFGRAESAGMRERDYNVVVKSLVYKADCQRLLNYNQKAQLSINKAFLLAKRELNSQDQAFAEIYEMQSNVSIMSGSYLRALTEIDKAIFIRMHNRQASDSLFAPAYCIKGYLLYCLNRKEEAATFFNLAIHKSILSKKKDPRHLSAYYYYAALTAFDLGLIQDSYKYFTESHRLHKQTSSKNWQKTSDFLISYSTLLMDLGMYNEAMRICDSIELSGNLRRSTTSEISNYLYSFKGTALLRIGDFHKAIDYFKKSEAMIKGKSDKELQLKIHAMNSIGNCYQNLGNYNLARKCYLDCLKLNEQYDLLDDALLYDGIASCSMFLGDTLSAHYYYNHAIILLEKKVNTNDLLLAHVYKNIGSLYTLNGKQTPALSFLKKALLIYEKNYGTKHPLVASCYEEIGDYYAKQHRHRVALVYYQKGIISNSKGFDDVDILSLPVIAQSISDIHMMALLEKKACELDAVYQDEGRKSIRIISTRLDCYTLCFSIINKLNRYYLAKESLLFLTGKKKDSYLKAILLAIELYEKTGDSRYKLIAFQFAEESKAALLKSTLAQSNAMKWNGLPDSLVKKEDQLKQFANAIQQRIEFERTLTKPDLHKLSQLENEAFSIKEKQNNLYVFLERNFPIYFNLKYKRSEYDLSRIISSLNHGDQIIEYVYMDSILIGFHFTTYGFEILKQHLNSEFADNLDFCKKYIRDYHPVKYDNSDIKKFSNSSYSIYKVLLKSIFKNGTYGQLYIVPDEGLSSLSFDVLLTDSMSRKCMPQDMPFLVRKVAVSYAYSVDQLLKSRDHIAISSGILAFAPYASGYSHKKNKFNCPDLPYSGSEVENIVETYGGKALYGSQANKSILRNKAKYYDIIHFATHAIIDEQESGESRLYLASDSKDDGGVLHANEIPAVKMDARMVVLSACNTGSGKFLRGEGVMSLAHSFACAGCSSVIMTLWATGDRSTNEIMTNFYKGLKNGLSKSAALQAAKIEFIRGADPLRAHPHYWAGIMAVGDNSGIISNSTGRWILKVYFLLSILISISCYLVQRYYVK